MNNSGTETTEAATISHDIDEITRLTFKYSTDSVLYSEDAQFRNSRCLQNTNVTIDRVESTYTDVYGSGDINSFTIKDKPAT